MLVHLLFHHIDKQMLTTAQPKNATDVYEESFKYDFRREHPVAL